MLLAIRRQSRQIGRRYRAIEGHFYWPCCGTCSPLGNYITTIVLARCRTPVSFELNICWSETCKWTASYDNVETEETAMRYLRGDVKCSFFRSRSGSYSLSKYCNRYAFSYSLAQRISCSCSCFLRQFRCAMLPNHVLPKCSEGSTDRSTKLAKLKPLISLKAFLQNTGWSTDCIMLHVREVAHVSISIEIRWRRLFLCLRPYCADALYFCSSKQSCCLPSGVRCAYSRCDLTGINDRITKSHDREYHASFFM